MVMDSHHFNIIRSKLVVGSPLSHVGESPLSHVGDVELLKNIIESFHEVWKWYNEYPELSSKIDNKLFRTIFEDLGSKFRTG